MSRNGECNVPAAAASVGTSLVVVAISVTSATTAKVVATSVEAVISAAASRSSTSSAFVHRSRRRTAIHSPIITATTAAATIIAGNVDGHVEVVANLERRLSQRLHVGEVLAATHCAADLPHVVGVGAAVGEDQCKVES